jgi:hypothetical protein
MKVAESERTFQASEPLADGQFGISEEGAVHVMRILRDKLYSDKVLAVLREYATNAWDAHVEAGKPTLPIKVTLPNHLDRVLRIRDWGLGMSQEAVLTRYTQFGVSDKRDTNAVLGSFGVGCKVGFAYSDTFTVTTWYGGIKCVYVATLDARDVGVMRLIHTEPCGDETGTEVAIPVKAGDTYEFRNKAQDLYRFFEPMPDLGSASVEAPEWIVKTASGGILSDSWYGNVYALMGGIPYQVDSASLDRKVTGDVYLFMDIGDIDITPDRERVEMTDRTLKAVVAKQASLWAELGTKLDAELDALTNAWDRRARYAAFGKWEKAVKRKKITTQLASIWAPKEFRVATLSCRDDGVWVSRKGWKGAFLQFDGILLNPGRERLNSRELDDACGDYLLATPSVHMTKQDFGAALRKWLASSDLEGIPVHTLGSFPLKPKSLRARRPKSSAPRGTFFRLVNHYALRGRKKSGAWEAVDTIPADGVWVPISRFVPQLGLDGRELLDTPLYGVKESYKGDVPGRRLDKALAEDCATWVREHQAECQAAVDRAHWGSRGRISPAKKDLLVRVLGADHPLVYIATGLTDEPAARQRLRLVGDALESKWMPTPTFTEEEFRQRYPILGTPSVHWANWADGLPQLAKVIKYLDDERGKEEANEQDSK